MISKILVAIDEWNLGGVVFNQALELAKATGSCLLLLHVLNPLDKDYPDAELYPKVGAYYPQIYGEMLKRWQEQLSEYEQRRLGILQSLALEAEAAGITAEFTQNIGAPGQVICAMARNWNADLIVIGRRGRAGMSELLLGSVSNYVMHHAPCSVLTVQGQTQIQPESEPEAAVTAG